jgi:hypothetical protein
MPRIYDDVSHFRQPYLRTLLDGSDREAVALGTYMTSGPVDARPLSVHAGYGVYDTRGPVDPRPIPISRGFGAQETRGPVDQPPLPITRGIGTYDTRGPVDPRPIPISRGFGEGSDADNKTSINPLLLAGGTLLLATVVTYAALHR